MYRAFFGMLWLKWVLGLLWLVLFIWALVDILDSKKKTAGVKFLWIVVCFILPLLGVLGYFLFGKDEDTVAPQIKQ